MSERETEEIQKQTFGEVLKNQEAVGFVSSLIKDSYQKFFTGHEEEVGGMVDKSWSILTSQAGTSNEELKQTVTQINSEIFHKQDPEFWFNSLYKIYKTKTRPEKDFVRLKPHIAGKRVLDYGSGGGYLAKTMAENGYEVSTTDVLDYRVPEAKHLPFRAMASPTDIPYPDDSFDTTIIKAVLHHIDPVNLPVVLRELQRVSKRVIIEEDTYDLPQDMPGLQELRQSQPQLEKFISMSKEDQLQCLMLIDYFSNAIAQGVVEMNFPFQFKSPGQWKEVLESHGFNLHDTKLLGFQDGNVSKNMSCLANSRSERIKNGEDKVKANANKYLPIKIK